MRVTFNEHNLSIIWEFVEHNRKIFGAVQHSIIGTFLKLYLIGSALIRDQILVGPEARLRRPALEGQNHLTGQQS